MLKEVTSEIKELSQDLCFVRNLSLFFVLATSCLFGLADLQAHNNKLPEQITVDHMSQPITKFVAEH